MGELQLRQFARLLVQRLRGKGFSRLDGTFEPRRLERFQVQPRHVAPDHFPTQFVGIHPDGGPADFVVQQADDFARDGLGIAKRHQHPAAFREQFRRVPVRRGNHHFARAKRISQRAGRGLRLVQIRREVQVRRADEFHQFVQFDEAVVKNDVFLDFPFFGQPFEAQPVGFALFAQQVGMGGAQYHVNHVGKLRQDLRQRVQHVLDALVR